MLFKNKKERLKRKYPQSKNVEEYRSIGLNLNKIIKKNIIKSLTITSSVEGEGKTTAAVELAKFYGEKENKKIIIIDCNSRNPSIIKQFNVDNKYGLWDFLMGNASIDNCIQKVNEYIDAAELGLSKSDEVITSLKLREILDELSLYYELIIIDSPSVLESADAEVISGECDGTLLIININKSKRMQVWNAKEKLEKCGANTIGVIVNDYIRGRFVDEKMFI
ncbi:MAG: CpsD/CapB family tyrosine-protein kinase [Clostridium sp.]